MTVLKTQIKLFLLVGILFFANNTMSFQTKTIEKRLIKIGVLAKRGQTFSLKKWGPTAQYLSSKIKEATFEIIPLKFEEIINAVSQQKIDFILANPSYYVELEYDFGVSRILTMRNLLNGKTYTKFGGIIFYKKSKNKIETYNDIIGKSVIAVDEQSFGGWRVSLYELLHHGIDPKVDFKSMQFAGTHDSVVYAIENGTFDIGCVRTEILEKMDKAGKINIMDFGIVDVHEKADCTVPFLHSTQLYPEWPLAKLPHISEEFAKSVAIALLKLDENSIATKAAAISGWTVPRNYQPVHDCLKFLKLGPYKNFGKIILVDVLIKYQFWIFALFILVLFLFLAIFYVAKLNKRLQHSKEKIDLELNERAKAEKSLEEVNENLELLVKERTSLLEESNNALLNEIKEHKLAQNDLVSEKEFSERIIDTSTAIIVGLSKDYIIKIFNKGAELVTGYTKDEVLGKEWASLFLLDEISEETSLVWQEDCGTSSHKYENIILTKSKEKRNISWQTTCLYEDDIRAKHLIISIGEDITERKEMEEELKRSKERYSRLSHLSYEGIIIHRNGIVIDLNAAFVKMFGFATEELIGRNVIELIIPQKYHEMVLERMHKAETEPYEIEGIRKDGTKFQIEVESKIINYGTNEQGVRVTSIRDITRRKKSEFEVYKLLNAVEQSSVSILITNINGKVEYVNPKFVETTGYSKEEMIGQYPSVIKSNFQPTEFYKNLWDTILSGQVWSGEFFNKKKNGELYWETAVISPIKDKEGNITHFVAIEEDVTEKKKMMGDLIKSKERAENADKMKSIFLAQMSHEIRTPINALISMSSLLKYDFEEAANEDQLMSFEIIERAGVRIIRTVDLLINLSEVQAGTYEPSVTKFDVLTDIISRMVAENKMLAKNKNVELNLICSAKSSELVADFYTVAQIFTQLIDNALKYTNEGAITVKILRNPSDNLIVEIEDTGIGIDKEYMPLLFEPFTQEEMGYTRKYEGNGIGLALVKKYCELNNAEIEVESNKGVGSIFRVVFY